MVHWSAVLLSSGLIHAARALPHLAEDSTSAPSLTISTVVASPSAPASSPLPSQVALPPKQDWCPSKIFCAGELLQSVNVANLYVDPKTFVDKPTSKSSQEVLDAFKSVDDSDVTNGELADFVDNNFRGEGLELEAVQIDNFNDHPSVLQSVSDPIVRGFTQQVHLIWKQLIRRTNTSTLCQDGSCESTLIPLNHTFVVPGGRFREQYYWDSFWIVQGLLRSELFDIVKETLENFMDELETIGFIPNGGRTYYLNRSQPPFFIHMLADYVAATNDTSILDRALPLAEVELNWWKKNRSIKIKSPYTNKMHVLTRYAVKTSAPRPESYLTDYLTANDPTLSTPLTEQERSDLYAELATGAETGWDYTARWMRNPFAGNSTDQFAKLRTLNVRNTVPICLNSILYKSHLLVADLYELRHQNASAASAHRHTAAKLHDAVLDLFWDASKLAFYDFNLTSNARNNIYSAAHFYPLWNGILPKEVVASKENAFGYFSALNMILNRYNGTLPVTLVATPFQWDFPNAWPQHTHAALEALRALPANVSFGALPTPQGDESTYSLIPKGQIDIAEDELPVQPVFGKNDTSRIGRAADINTLNGTIVNGGNRTDGEGWAATLQRELANRYITSAFCSWRGTGGSIPGLLPRLSDAELNVTQSVNNTGVMFEKFSATDIDSAGRGGEYVVQAGFGWTNGEALWIADVYGDVLVAPDCPDLLLEQTTTGAVTDANANAAASRGAAPVVTIALALVAAVVVLLN